MSGSTPERKDFRSMLAAIEKVRGRSPSFESLRESSSGGVDWLARCTSILGVGTAIWAHRGKLTEISPTLERMTLPWGTPEAWWMMLVAEVGPRVMASRLGAGAELDVHLSAPDGARYSFRLTASGFVGAGESSEGAEGPRSDMILLVSDTTASEQTQRALQATEKRYASLFQGSSDGILLHDLEGRILEANSAGLEMLGLTDEDLLEKRILDLHPESELPAAHAAFEAVSSRGNARFEIKFKRPDGSVFPAEVSASLLQVEERELVQAMVRDITERKLAEETLRQSEARKSAMLETALDCIVTIDHVGRIVEFNPAAEATFGHRKEDVIGHSMAELLLPEEHREAHSQGMDRFRSTGEARILGQRLELPALRSDGQVLLMEVAITRLPNPGGEPLFAGYMRDITSRKEAERRMSQALSEAKEANRAKSDFLASMSHELRTPLNVISGMTELARDEKEDGDISSYLDAIGSSASSLLHLIDDLLDISRIEAGRFEISLRPLEIRPLIEDVCSPLEHRADRKSLSFTWGVADSVPATLAVDAKRLRQVLLNLLNNAIKFTEEGSVSLRVSSEPRGERRHYLIFEVSDTGVGFDPAQSDQVFERFHQLRRPSGSRPDGTGLGLAISQALAELMGGELQAESVKGRGSVFRLLMEAEEAAAAEPTTGHLQSHEPPTGSQQTILLVDDHAANRVVAARFLEKGGYRVLGAESGEQALEIMGSTGVEISLVLMDIEMPGLTGFETTRRLRRLETAKDLPIVALTAHAVAGFRERCLEAGMSDYLSKPVERESLLRSVATNLGIPTGPVPGELSDLPAMPEPSMGKPAVETSPEQVTAGGEPVMLSLDSEIGDLLPEFLERCRESIEELCELSTDAFDRARRIGHNLKGSGAAYGLPEITRLGSDLELAAANDEPWRPLAHQLRDYVARIRLQ